MQNIIQRLVRVVFKVLLVGFGLVFAISLLLAALIVIGFSLLKSLVTGKKPTPLVVLRRFQQFAPSNVWPGTRKAQNANNVVDVDVREVREVSELQPDQQQRKSEKPKRQPSFAIVSGAARARIYWRVGLKHTLTA